MTTSNTTSLTADRIADQLDQLVAQIRKHPANEQFDAAMAAIPADDLGDAAMDALEDAASAIESAFPQLTGGDGAGDGFDYVVAGTSLPAGLEAHVLYTPSWTDGWYPGGRAAWTVHYGRYIAENAYELERLLDDLAYDLAD